MPTNNNPIPHHVLNRRRDEANSSNITTDAAAADAAVAAAGLGDIAVHPEHAAELLETEKNTVESLPKFRKMIAEMMRWWKANYPELYDKIVFDLTDEEKNDLSKHYHDATRDLRYDLLDPKWVKLFLSGEKKWKDKAKKIQYGFDHPRRYHDAILKCSGLSQYQLHPRYRTVMKAYLDNMKKEKAKAKGKNQVEEHDADPIGIGLYEQLCEWAVEAGTKPGVFVWAFMTMQWNIMGRTVNVDPLGFHNIKKSQHDSIILQYDSNKMDNLSSSLCTQ